MKRLVIDLGHGGKDPGAVGDGGRKESDIVLQIGKELNNLLKSYDLEVKFIRLLDTYLSLSERVRIANSFKADYFISIHINSTENKTIRGVEVWQYDKDNVKLNKFSEDICRDISKVLNIKNRGIKLSKDFTVLRNTTMPAALIEVDFISNVNCERDLNDNNKINAIALAIRNNVAGLFELEVIIREKLYRVCIGAYKEKNNAINQVRLAKSKGFGDTYII